MAPGLNARNAPRQQRLDSFTQPDGTLKTTLLQLSLNDIDEDAWEAFLQSERINSLIEPLLTINYGHGLTSGDDNSRHHMTIAQSFREIIRLLKTKNAIHNDTFFWSTVKDLSSPLDEQPLNVDSIPCVDNVSSLGPVRSLLLLLVQCICDGKPGVALPATELFLLLCRLPHSIENFFSPNLFIGQRLLQPFSLVISETPSTNRKSNKEQKQPQQTQDEELLSDEELEHIPSTRLSLPLTTSSATSFALPDIESLLDIITVWVSDLNMAFVQLELGRELVLLVMDTVTQIVFRGSEETLKESAFKCIIRFMRQLDGKRHELISASMFNNNSMKMNSTEFRKFNEYVENEELQDIVAHDHSIPTVPLYSGGPLGDVLIWGLGTFIHHTVRALALGGRRVGTTVTTVPKPLLMLRKITIELISELITSIPSLLDPKHLIIVNTNQRKRLHVNDSDVDEENTAKRKGVRRRRRKAESDNENDEVAIASDDEEALEEKQRKEIKKDDMENEKPVKVKNTKSIRMKRELKEKAEQRSNDPILAVVSRACLTVADRKEWREYLAKAIIEIIEKVEPIEKKELREKYSDNIVGLPSLVHLPEDLNQDHIKAIEALPFRGRVTYFIAKLLQCSKASWRMISLDVCLSLLESSLTQNGSDLPNFLKEIPCQILTCILPRVHDTQQGVRARTLECIASLIQKILSEFNIESYESQTQSGNLQRFILGCLYIPFKNSVRYETSNGQQSYNEINGMNKNDDIDHDVCIDLSKMIRERIVDDKQIVRKSTLNLIIAVAEVVSHFQHTIGMSQSKLDHLLINLGAADPNVLRSLCLDSSLQVRVKALSTIHSLTELFPTSKDVARLWLDEALPAVNDPEKLVSERLIELVQSTIINGLSDMFNSSVQIRVMIEQIKNHEQLAMPLGLLSIATEENIEYLQRSIAMIYKKTGTIPTQFIKGIRQFLQAVSIESTLAPSQWPTFPFHIIQEIISLQPGFISSRLLCKCWNIIASHISSEPSSLTTEISKITPTEDLRNSSNTLAIAKCLLICITEQTFTIDLEDRKEIFGGIQQAVESMSAPLGLISPLVKALMALSHPGYQSGNTVKLSQENISWLHGLLKTIQNELSAIVQTTAKEIVSWRTPLVSNSVSALQSNQSALCRYLFTLGELAYTWNATIPSPLITLIQAFATDTLGSALAVSASAHLRRIPIDQTPAGTTQQALDLNKSRFQATSSRSSLEICRSDKRFSIPETVRGQAFLSLGKICLRNESLGKRLIETFVGHLGAKESPIIRNTILVVFSDLSVRYTSLTDQYIPQFSSCLADQSSPMIRKQCLTLLAGLVAQDYVKCKGLIVFRLLTSLSDTHKSIRELAEAVALNIILPRQANFIQNHFLEMLCFMSGWIGHPIFRPSAVGGASFVYKSSPFCLLQYPHRRQIVYQFFFQQMSERDKHEISRKLVHDFLAAFVDNDELTGRAAVVLPKSVDEPAGSALRDALKLLGCKQMKISFGVEGKKQSKASVDEQPSADQTGEENEEAEGQKAAYELSLLKRNLAFQILPTLLSLKRLMEDDRSTFLRDILLCISGLLYDYRNELSEILFHDPMLARQLEVDFKRRLFQESDITISSQLLDPSQHSSTAQQILQIGAGGRRGRPSLLLDTSPGIDATDGRTHPSNGELAVSSASRQRRRSIELLGARRSVRLSIPRLRAEAVALLSERKEAEIADSDHQLCGRDFPSRRRRGGSLSTIHSITSPTQHSDGRTPSVELQEKPSVPALQLGRTEDERAEQELVLSALRSRRMRHSLPSACGPAEETSFASVGKINREETSPCSPRQHTEDLEVAALENRTVSVSGSMTAEHVAEPSRSCRKRRRNVIDDNEDTPPQINIRLSEVVSSPQQQKLSSVGICQVSRERSVVRRSTESDEVRNESMDRSRSRNTQRSVTIHSSRGTHEQEEQLSTSKRNNGRSNTRNHASIRITSKERDKNEPYSQKDHSHATRASSSLTTTSKEGGKRSTISKSKPRREITENENMNPERTRVSRNK